ncbi:hypothetical protein AB851_23590 [Ralstonia pseudosolanacearum]|nr:hypothetical protein AB851_23590 [Ralstonia pseudosolanacearum]
MVLLLERKCMMAYMVRLTLFRPALGWICINQIASMILEIMLAFVTKPLLRLITPIKRKAKV